MKSINQSEEAMHKSSYSNAYQSDNQFSLDSTDLTGVRKGVFAYTEPNGKMHHTFYTADKKGFRLNQQNEILRSLPRKLNE